MAVVVWTSLDFFRV